MYLTAPGKLGRYESIVSQSYCLLLLDSHKRSLNMKLTALQTHLRTLNLRTHLNVSVQKVSRTILSREGET